LGAIDEINGRNRRQYRHDRGNDLDRAVWPFANDLTGVGVDIDVERLAAGEVRRDPQRQQQQAEQHVLVVCRHLADALLVTTDVGAAVALDHGSHVPLRRGEARVGVDVITG